MSRTIAAAKSAYADYRDKADKWKERYGENAQKREESVYSRLQGERVKEVRKNLGLTLEKFGERIGLKKNTMSAIETGRNALLQIYKRYQTCKEFSKDVSQYTTGSFLGKRHCIQ